MSELLKKLNELLISVEKDIDNCSGPHEKYFLKGEEKGIKKAIKIIEGVRK